MADTPLNADWGKDVLHFWYEELTPEDWYGGAADVDERIKARFGDLPGRLARQLPPQVMTDPMAALAAIIALDQFPRNIYRRKPEAFATDDLAASITRNALDKELDAGLPTAQRQFLYMPLMHSEVLADQERCVDLFKALGGEEGVKYAVEHRDIIARFGRFPHRNRVLERETTEEEAAFLETHDGYGQ